MSSINIAARLFSRQVSPTSYPIVSNVKWLHSGFNQVYTFRTPQGAQGVPFSVITAAAFVPIYSNGSCIDDLILGTSEGTFSTHSIHNEALLASSPPETHPAAIRVLSTTSPSYSRPTLIMSICEDSCAKLWDVKDISIPLATWDDALMGEFSYAGDRVITSTNVQHAEIRDSETGIVLTTLKDTAVEAQQRRHTFSDQALFSPDDQLALSAASLFDLRSAKVIHRFDQLLSMDYSSWAAFDPAGVNIVINAAVWDIRNLKLSCVVSSLRNSKFRYSADGSALYSHLNMDLGGKETPFDSSVRVLNVSDGGFKDLCCVDVETKVADIAVDHSGQHVVLVEAASDAGARLVKITGRRPESDSDVDDSDDNSEGPEHDEEEEEDDEDGEFGDHFLRRLRRLDEEEEDLDDDVDGRFDDSDDDGGVDDGWGAFWEGGGDDSQDEFDGSDDSDDRFLYVYSDDDDEDVYFL